MDFDTDQERAISDGIDVSKRVVAITGEAGTGKTVIMKMIHDGLLEHYDKKDIVLCAPTGKAAKRITEATGIVAKTIHRLLEYPYPGEIDPETGKAGATFDPRRHRRNPIEEKVILADEYAMTNVEAHRNLFDAIPNGGLIRLFGDASQLAPIESIKRLKEQPSSFDNMLVKFDGIRLKTIHRQEGGSDIIENGHRILLGNMPRKTEDFKLKITSEPIRVVADIIMDGVTEGSDAINFCTLVNQMIAPVKVGWVGTLALNAMIQSLYQSSTKRSQILERHTWDKRDFLEVFIDDKVMWTVNNYGLGIFNGETGIVTEITELGEVIIDLGDREIAIPPVQEVESRNGLTNINPQRDLELAYVITTHKAQGSEYDNVVYIMNSSRSWPLNKRNFYTGITRAKHTVQVVSDQKALFLSLTKKGNK